MANKAHRKANARRASKPIEIPTELWDPPSPAECEEDVVDTSLDDLNRITMKLVKYEGQLVNYSVTYWTSSDGRSWEEVVSIDCYHQHIHRHNGKHHELDQRSRRPIYRQSDVQGSFDASFDEVYGEYEQRQEQA